MHLIKEFTQTLRFWYLENGRDLPWRHTKDPYKIWISEVILQQTQVEQGLAYYHRFLHSFPDTESLAKASIDRVLKIWQGLGYYSRARNLHATAKLICELPSARFPASYSELLPLKGIGPYTAAAIASFAYNEPRAVVDGNVYRFLSRCFGINTPIDSTEGKKAFALLADQLLDRSKPGTHNQAMMELGATICKPANPNCKVCPFSDDCMARRLDNIQQLPVKSKKTTIRNRYFHFLIIHDGQMLLLRQRHGKDIWQGLFEFPLIETDSSSTDLSNLPLLRTLMPQGFEHEGTSHEYVHLLSHQRLDARFHWFIVPPGAKKKLPADILCVPFHQLEHYALPRLIDRYMRNSEDDILWNRLGL